jgi:hypothetical protein
VIAEKPSSLYAYARKQPYCNSSRLQVGLASLSLALQRGGGSTEFPATVLDAQLEDIAARIEARAGQQNECVLLS